MPEFSATRILNLIEKAGHLIDLCQAIVIQPANPAWGSPEIVEHQCRAIRGYVIPEKIKITAVNGTQTTIKSGEYIGYFSTKDIQGKDLNETSLIRWEGRYYKPVYLQAIRFKGVEMISRFKLAKTQEQPAVQ